VIVQLSQYARIAVCAATVVCLLPCSGCYKQNEYVPPPPPAVTVEQPVEREIVEELEFTGSTRAAEAVDIRARVNGYLQEIKFEDGADVKAGDVLFVIEAAPFQATLDAAKASLQKAEASLALAEAELERTAPLVKRGALSENELDVKKADVATAKADVAAAKAAIRQAELNLGYTQVKSPFSGRISRHLVDVGNLVTAETTLLTRVEVLNPIHAYFAVSESDVLKFLENNEGRISEGSANQPKLYLGLTGGDGFPYEGRLDFAELGVDTQTGTQMRRGVFPNPKGQLLPGLFVRIRLPVGGPKPRVLVPDRAIATDQRGEYVLVVNDKNVVEYRPVQLGTRINEMRVVSSGLAMGDWIVVNGLQRARPGGTVTPQRQENVALNSDSGSVSAAKGDKSQPEPELASSQSASAVGK
jgi:RND family efflux transporter MFP subunit